MRWPGQSAEATIASSASSRHRPRLTAGRAVQPPVGASPLALTTSDGVALSALMYGPTDADVAVVFGHGFNGSQRNPKVVGLAHDLVDRGFAVYTADFRGHGASAGRSTFGDREVEDLEAVVAVARAAHGRVVSVGSSMGAFAALRHAGLRGNVDAVVAISSPAFGTISKLPRARVLGRIVRSERGRRLLARRGTRAEPFVPVAVPPIEVAHVISPTPVAIVHGMRDRYVPVSEAHALHERLRAPRRLVVLPSFGHGEAGFEPGFAAVLDDLIRELLDGRLDAGPSNAEDSDAASRIGGTER
jgi:pimeloyl-ACP methyl ester carboxylesterase